MRHAAASSNHRSQAHSVPKDSVRPAGCTHASFFRASVPGDDHFRGVGGLLAFSPGFDDDHVVLGASSFELLASADAGSHWHVVLAQRQATDDCPLLPGCALCRLATDPDIGTITYHDSMIDPYHSEHSQYCLQCAATWRRLPIGTCVRANCVDTHSWTNGRGQSCDDYTQWCDGRTFRIGESRRGGKEFNFPERHCCICGGSGTPAIGNVSSVVRSTGNGSGAVDDNLGISGSGGAKLVSIVETTSAPSPAADGAVRAQDPPPPLAPPQGRAGLGPAWTNVGTPIDSKEQQGRLGRDGMSSLDAQDHARITQQPTLMPKNIAMDAFVLGTIFGILVCVLVAAGHRAWHRSPNRNTKCIWLLGTRHQGRFSSVPQDDGASQGDDI